MKTNIKCRFCHLRLTLKATYGSQTNTVYQFDCEECKEKFVPYHSFEMSKHQAFLAGNLSVIEERIIAYKMMFQIHYDKQTTTLHQYVGGGPMEWEMHKIATLPFIQINPFDPKLQDKIKLWLTFQ